MANAYLQQLFGASPGANGSSTPAFTLFSLNANNDAQEFIVQAHAAATVTRLGCRLGAITGTTPTYRISAQGVDSTGVPNGTLKGATNNALKTFSPTSLGWGAGSWNWLTLDETFDVARGEFFSIVIDYSSGTIDGSNFASFTSHHNTATTTRRSQFYSINNDATVRARVAGTLVTPVVGYGSASLAFGWPIESTSTQSLTAASNPREAGMKFSLPAGWGDSYKVVGVMWNSNSPVTGNTTIRLYEGGGSSDTTVLQDLTLANANFEGTAGDRRGRLAYFDEPTLATLLFGNEYRLSFESSVSTMTLHYMDVDAVDDWYAWPSNQQISWTSRPSAGSWTDVATRRLTDFALILDDITEPAGGLLIHPGMGGGCRG